MRPIAEVVSDIERYGFRLYLDRAGVIRAKRPQKEPSKDKLWPKLKEANNRKAELIAYLKQRDTLLGNPVTPEEDRRVKEAFTRPQTFLVYDEAAGVLRWIC